jgi:D-glycero-D-manno-heptose 1,7-bisphosphate phosphatase
MTMVARPAMFLDRDGVINVDIGYLHRPEDCVFVEGIFDLVKRAGAAGLLVFVVTNQAGIGRGYYDEAQFAHFTSWMLQQFVDAGAPLTKVYHCPHHPTDALSHFRVACDCRKPEPGMFLQAAREFDVDMARSTMVGDKASDLLAAARAGVGRRVLYLGGGLPEDARATVDDGVIFADTLDAIRFERPAGTENS